MAGQDSKDIIALRCITRFRAAVAAAIETERRLEVEAIQALQVRMKRAINLPFPMRLVVLGLIVPTVNRLHGTSHLTKMQFGITKVEPRFLPPTQLAELITP